MNRGGLAAVAGAALCATLASCTSTSDEERADPSRPAPRIGSRLGFVRGDTLPGETQLEPHYRLTGTARQPSLRYAMDNPCNEPLLASYSIVRPGEVTVHRLGEHPPRTCPAVYVPEGFTAKLPPLAPGRWRVREVDGAVSWYGPWVELR